MWTLLFFLSFLSTIFVYLFIFIAFNVAFNTVQVISMVVLWAEETSTYVGQGSVL